MTAPHSDPDPLPGRSPTNRSFLAARELRESFPPGRRNRSALIGWAIVLANVVAYAFCFYLTHAGDPFGLRLACAVLTGFVTALLFIVGHDACHGCLVPGAGANRLIARLCFLPSAQPYASWFVTHNGYHHGWTNLRGKDPVFAPFTKAEYDALPAFRRWLERVYRTPLGIGLQYLVEVWWKLEIFPSAPHRPKNRRVFFLDRLAVAVFALGQFALALWLASGEERVTPEAVVAVLGLLAVSYGVWFWLVGFVTYQQHTHYAVPWFNSAAEWCFFRGQVQCCPHVVFPTWVHRLLHNVMDHSAHHVDPLIPLYRLPPSERALEEAVGPPLRTVNWTLAEMFRVFRRCRLYDYERHQWLDFDGTPTSESGLDRIGIEPAPVPHRAPP